MIRTIRLSDAQEITEIYTYFILHSTATFEEIPITADTMNERIQKVTEHLPWLVFEENNQVLGYAYASEWKPRSAYRYTVESTVYIHKESVGKHIGSVLMNALIKELRQLKLHAILAGITLPNESSITLHEKLGFKKVAHLKEVGFKFNQRLDVGYWELILGEPNAE